MLSNCKGNVVNRMNLEQYKGVFIYAQQVDNKIDAIALDLNIGLALQLNLLPFHIFWHSDQDVEQDVVPISSPVVQ